MKKKIEKEVIDKQLIGKLNRENYKLTRSNRAAEFLHSTFWLEDLKPWIDKEKHRLAEDNMGFPDTDKFREKRERNRTRYIACDIVPQVISVWQRERGEIEKSRELKKADNAMIGAK